MRLYSTVYIIIFAVNTYFTSWSALVKFTSCAMHVCTWWTDHMLPQAAKIKTKVCVANFVKFIPLEVHLNHAADIFNCPQILVAQSEHLSGINTSLR